MARKEKQEQPEKQPITQPIKLAVFAGFPPREGKDGKPEVPATPVGHIPPVTLVIGNVTLLVPAAR